MNDFSKEIDNIAVSIKKWEKDIENAAHALRLNSRLFSSGESSRAVEGSLFTKVEPDKLHGVSYIGVDGGLLKKEYHGIDIIATRAVAVKFAFENGKLYDTVYFPSPAPQPDVNIIKKTLADAELSVKASLLRMKDEINTAVSSIYLGCTMLVLDGSVVPHPQSRPAKDSALYKEYSDVIAKYIELYKKCADKNIYLCGAVEDSRSTTACDILSSIFAGKGTGKFDADALENVKDTHLFSYLLNPGERSFVFRYFENPSSNLILKDLGEFGGNIYSFYIRCAEFDRPMRVDFLSGTNRADDVIKTADRIASLLLAISRHHSTYGCPSVIIEADRRAKLDEKEMHFIESEINSRVGNITGFSDLRRNSRPF